jgi:hypothetical protein
MTRDITKNRTEHRIENAVANGPPGPGGAGTPEWVVRAPMSLSYVWCMAVRGVMEDRAKQESAGIVATLCWIHGLLTGAPATGREDPPTEQVAQGEAWAAISTRSDWPAPPLTAVYQALELSYRAPLDLTPGYAFGVFVTVLWLTGEQPQPPIPIPARTETGQLASVEAIYAGLLAARTGYVPLIVRRALRRTAATILAESEELAQIISDTARRIRG